MYTHIKSVVTAGVPAGEAEKAIILLHGRGANAHSILQLAGHLNVENAALYAPEATNNSWYPYSFLTPVADNQPALDSALAIIGETVAEVLASGIPLHKIYFAGFSQGACLTLEYVARNAKGYGGVVAFTGGLIGESLNLANYQGDFLHTPALITTGDPDPHVPVSRVNESADLLENLKAEVSVRIFKGRMHTISPEEIRLANSLVLV
jgi:phospholipase/carboxylesterase